MKIPRITLAAVAALLAAGVGARLLLGESPQSNIAVPPPEPAPARQKPTPTSPKAGAPGPKAAPRASPEPTEAQLPPVDPAWHRQGWRAVVPHGYVLRGLAPARSRPEPGAPAAFWLKGGTRVPILEQRRDWWRVGWTHGQTGWMPAADLQPHASFILLDARTGRVLHRLAAKGEQGPVAADGFLWSFSDTGITRTSLADPPAIWSNPARRDPHGSLPESGVWTPDRSAFFVRATPDDTGPLIEVSARTGAVRQAVPADNSLAVPNLERADTKGRTLFSGPAALYLYDTSGHREIRRAPGQVRAVAKSGAVYAFAKAESGKHVLVRYDPELNPASRVKMAGEPSSVRLSAHERVLALTYDDKPIELRRADTLARVTVLHRRGNVGASDVSALAGGANGWWVIGGDAEEDNTSVTHYTRQGLWLRTWHSDSALTLMSPDGHFIYMPRESDLLVIETTRATTRRIPFSWRRPLPQRYLPKPADPDSPPHLYISALTLTPDGRTLVLTEWLNGDPET